jgi:hypothetical protein
MGNKWYVAKLVLRCRVGNDQAGPWSCDEPGRARDGG